MAIEIMPADHQLVLHEEPIEVFVGDQVEFTLSDWQEGDVRISGEVTRLYDHARAKVRVATGAFSVPVAALQIIDRAA